jgi:integrase
MSAALTLEEAQPRRVGRPSKVEAFRPLAAELLGARPRITTREILEAVKARGFGGAKSAVYDMVARLRSEVGVQSALASIADAAATRREERLQLRIKREEMRTRRRAERERWDAAERERIAAKAGERVEERLRRERASEDRKTDWEPLQLHPTAEHEESTKLRVYARRWFDSREATHKANRNERCRWTVHLATHFGDLEPAEVDTACIRAFVEDRLARLSSTTVKHLIATLSSLFSDLVDQGVVARNPVRSMPRALKRLCRNAHDPRTTPFLERMEDIARLRASLTEPLRTLFSVGVMSGLRPGELVALEWADLRSDFRLMHVQRRYRQGTIDVPKSGKTRTISVAPALAEVLREWRALTDGEGLVFKPIGKSRCLDLQLQRLRKAWRDGLKRAGLPYMKFYWCTRHTFASQWVMAGHSIEKLSKMLGHSSIIVTEVYAHLKPESLNIPDVISFGQRSSDPTVGA